MRPHGAQRGITIQELLLVMAIFTMAIVSIPNLNGFYRALQARTAVNEIVGSLNLARSLAVRARASHVFIPHAGTSSWELRNVETGAVVRRGELPSGVTHVVMASFQFDEDGHCVNPTTFSGTTPSDQYLQVEADLLAGEKVRYTLSLSPLSRVTTTSERLSS